MTERSLSTSTYDNEGLSWICRYLLSNRLFHTIHHALATEHGNLKLQQAIFRAKQTYLACYCVDDLAHHNRNTSPQVDQTQIERQQTQ